MMVTAPGHRHHPDQDQPDPSKSIRLRKGWPRLFAFRRVTLDLSYPDVTALSPNFLFPAPRSGGGCSYFQASDEIATFTSPFASATTRRFLSSKAMPSKRSSLTVTLAVTPGAAPANSEAAAAMRFLASSANGLRSITACSASVFCR